MNNHANEELENKENSKDADPRVWPPVIDFPPQSPPHRAKTSENQKLGLVSLAISVLGFLSFWLFARYRVSVGVVISILVLSPIGFITGVLSRHTLWGKLGLGIPAGCIIIIVLLWMLTRLL